MLKSVVACTVFALIARQCWIIIEFLDLGKPNLKIYHPGKCKPIAGTEFGSEDVQTMPDGLAFISSVCKPTPGRRGSVLLYDFNNPDMGAVECKISGGIDLDTFWPHGINVWKNQESGEITLFVTTHAPERIEKFIFHRENRSLVHQESIKSDMFEFVNDVAATSESSFYFTNTFTSKTSIPDWLRDLLFIFRLANNGNVGYYSNDKATILTQDVDVANGIFLSNDKRKLYVASWSNREVHVFNIGEDKEIIRDSVISLDFHVDNIHVDESGDIFCAGQPLAHQILKTFALNVSGIAASKASRVHMRRNGSYVITDVMVDDGHTITGSSTANRFKNKLIVGTVYTSAFVCDGLKD